MKSPLRYPGGKSRLIKEILKFKPKDITEYREPFLGGGSLFFHLLDDKEIEIFKASDTFPELINFYQTMLQSPQELVQVIEKMKMTNEPSKLFSFSKSLLTNKSSHSNIEQAAAFFILNRTSFSGLTMSGGFSKASYDGRFKKAHIEKCGSLKNVKKQIQIKEASYEELLFQPTENKTWIFLDPPYDIKSSNLYGKNGDGHKGFDHEKLAIDCKNSQHQWLITYNNNKHIRNLYEGWAFIQEVDVVYNMNSSGKKRKELFITNYKVDQ